MISKTDRASGGSAFCRTFCITFLAASLGFVLYNYWTMIVAHRIANEKFVNTTADYNKLKVQKLEVNKGLEKCTEQMKNLLDENKKLKDAAEAKQQSLNKNQKEISDLENKLKSANEDRASLQSKLESEKKTCAETADKREAACKKECEGKVSQAKAAAEESCKQQQNPAQQQQ